MHFDESMKFYIQRCEHEISKYETIISGMPEGSLQISKNGEYFSWRVMYADKSRTYLSKQNEELAQTLAQKKYLEAKLDDMKEEAAACQTYLKHTKDHINHEERLIKNADPEFLRLLNMNFQTKDARIIAWENEPYKKSNKYPEQLRYPTLKPNERVRSKFEASMARSLLSLNIPYKYEKVTLIGNTEIAIDFLALDARNFREIIIELFGMLNKPEYRKSHDWKMVNYINAGYIPNVNMLTFYETPQSPMDPLFMRQVLEDFFFNNPPILF